MTVRSRLAAGMADRGRLAAGGHRRLPQQHLGPDPLLAEAASPPYEVRTHGCGSIAGQTEPFAPASRSKCHGSLA